MTDFWIGFVYGACSVSGVMFLLIIYAVLSVSSEGSEDDEENNLYL